MQGRIYSSRRKFPTVSVGIDRVIVSKWLPSAFDESHFLNLSSRGDGENRHEWMKSPVPMFFTAGIRTEINHIGIGWI